MADKTNVVATLPILAEELDVVVPALASDDETLAEIQAMIGWGRNDLYPISPRCLVVLRPDAIPDLVEELRRKGYTPQVKL